jgi:peptidoglycan/xylan/chitin deacetylase (PgdA/CDA1 family)
MLRYNADMPKSARSRPAKSRPQASRRQLLLLTLFAVLIITAGCAWLLQRQVLAVASFVEPGDIGPITLAERGLRLQLERDRSEIGHLLDNQTRAGVEVVSPAAIQQRLTLADLDLRDHNIAKTRHDLAALSDNTVSWQAALERATAKKSAKLVIDSWQVPIIMYHKTPPDLAQQLRNLEDKNYTVIDLDQLALAMSGTGTLPKKSVILTFDDGFADQMKAFDILQAFDAKATFYIIDGGPDSGWCIGASRHDGLDCGDSYLTWDQVRQLDKSGLITIASHTIDHPNLASMTEEQQRYEILEGKAELERQIGHTVHHLAYPYGSYDSISIKLAKEAGFDTAVTTLPGIVQIKGSEYTLHRERSAYSLP